MYPEPVAAEAYAHVGVADVHEDEREGLTCDDCQYHLAVKADLLATNYDAHWAGLSFASVPGGASVARPGGGRGEGPTRAQHLKQFEKGLDTYRDNKKAGLRTGTGHGALKTATERAERDARLVKKHQSGDLDARGITLEKPLRDKLGIK